ncbi:MAG: glutaredoxin family protein [Candidatus Pacebacteria bacterium]|nr:glutaredoxin family protein [Candidatus Paceibacterota bacterium]
MTENQKKVIVYSTPTCMHCNMVKEYFDEKGVKYESIDVIENQEKGKYIVEKTGQMGVPVVEIDGEFVIGFNQPLIAEKLNLS